MIEIDLSFLGKRVALARKNCGLTQQELANQTGLASKTVQAIEDEELQHFVWKFQFCTPQNQKMLLNVLNLLAEQLLERERESERPK